MWILAGRANNAIAELAGDVVELQTGTDDDPERSGSRSTTCSRSPTRCPATGPRPWSGPSPSTSSTSAPSSDPEGNTVMPQVQVSPVRPTSKGPGADLRAPTAGVRQRRRRPPEQRRAVQEHLRRRDHRHRHHRGAGGDLAIADPTVSIPVGDFAIGPFEDVFPQISGTDAGWVAIEYSSVTGLTRTVMALRPQCTLPRSPLWQNEPPERNHREPDTFEDVAGQDRSLVRKMTKMAAFLGKPSDPEITTIVDNQQPAGHPERLRVGRHVLPGAGGDDHPDPERVRADGYGEGQPIRRDIVSRTSTVALTR
jgi:hypothetical protein